MEAITVAIADVDRERRAGYERLLEGQHGITLLTNVATKDEDGCNQVPLKHQHSSRTYVTAFKDEIVRIKRLKPLVILVNLGLSEDEDHALLLTLRSECPEVHIVVLADDAMNESKIIQALEIGARGYLKYETVELHLSKAVKVVGRGEAWVPRKMLGSIMDRVLN